MMNWLKSLSNRIRNWRALNRTPLRLWVDAKRPAPEGWYWAKTADEAKDVLASCLVYEASFGHDLGPGETGYDLMVWLANNRKRLGLNFWPLVRPTVHSHNSVDREKMEDIIQRYGPYINDP
jgi:hypothetical protein